jgi:hypothetical protein
MSPGRTGGMRSPVTTSLSSILWMSSRLMVAALFHSALVDYFNVVRVAVFPAEAHAPLAVHVAVLPCPISFQGSNRFDAWFRRSARESAASNAVSLRRAELTMSVGNPSGFPPAKTATVRLSAKVLITGRYVARNAHQLTQIVVRRGTGYRRVAGGVL